MKHNQEGISQNAVLGLVIVGTATLFILGAFIFTRFSRVGTGPEFSPENGPALLNNSVDLYNALGDPDYFNAVAENLGFYGRQTIGDLKDDPSHDVPFVVTGQIKKEGDEVSFSGKLAGKKIEVMVWLLKYGRIRMEIKGAEELNAQLPSNSKRNQYIATLPKNTETYTIDYLEPSDTFTVQLYESGKKLREDALQDLEQGVGYEIERSEYLVTTSIEDQGGIPLPPGVDE